jgi:hypothetical protein
LVGRLDPADLAGEALERELHPLAAPPQPQLAGRAELGEALEDHRDRALDRLVGVEQQLAVGLAPDQPDRQPAAQLAALRLVADPALEAGAQRVSSASDIMPLSPSSRRSLNEPGW